MLLKKGAFTVCTVIGMIVLFLVACSEKRSRPQQAESLKKAGGTIRISYGMFIDDLPFYVAQEEGFWSDEGLKVEMVRLKGENNIMAAAMKGDIQGGGLDLPSAFHASLQDLPFKVVAWFGRANERTRCGIHVDKESKIFNVKDLKGKTLVVSGSMTPRTILHEALLKNNMTIEDLNVVKGVKIDYATQQEAALRAKGVDGIIA